MLQVLKRGSFRGPRDPLRVPSGDPLRIPFTVLEGLLQGLGPKVLGLRVLGSTALRFWRGLLCHCSSLALTLV